MDYYVDDHGGGGDRDHMKDDEAIAGVDSSGPTWLPEGISVRAFIHDKALGASKISCSN